VQLKTFKEGKLRLAVAIDGLARPVFALWAGLRRLLRSDGTRPARRDRILVVQTGGVGDVVMSLPALRALRSQFPLSMITLTAGPWARDLLKEEDVVNEIVGVRPPWLGRRSLRQGGRFWWAALRLRRPRFDLGLDLRGDPRSLLFLYVTGAQERVSYAWYGAHLGEYLLTHVVPGPLLDAHLVDRFSTVVAALGCPPESRVPRIHLAASERVAASAWRRSVQSQPGNRPLLGIHPGAGNVLRQWSPDRFAAVINRLISVLPTDVVVFAGPGEEAIAADIVRRAGNGRVMESLPLRELIIRLSALDGLLALDSSPAHIAAALGVPVVCLFGPTLPEFGGPIGPTVRTIQEGVFECRPCTQERCVHPEASCMDAISVELVLRLTTEILRDTGVHENDGARIQRIRQ
jgi:heptosyltransferase-2